MIVILTYASLCVFCTRLTDDIEKSLKSLCETIEVQDENSVEYHPIKKIKHFSEIVQFHADAQQLNAKTFSHLFI